MKILFSFIFILLFSFSVIGQSATKKLVIIAGKPSHKAGEHEYNAGTLLIKKCLTAVKNLEVIVCQNGFPKDTSVLASADGILLFMDGKQTHQVLQPEYQKQVQKALKRGAGFGCLHWAVTLPAGNGEPLMDMLGGFKEDTYSAHGFWTSDFTKIPKHPVNQGVKPFSIYDECYFFLRFLPDSKRIIALLRATPPDSVRNTPASKQFSGREETIAWAYQRPDGGRSYGNTSMHYHKNWKNESLRKQILNAMLWICKLPIPKAGVKSEVTDEDLTKNLDVK